MKREELIAYAVERIDIGNEPDALVQDVDVMLFLMEHCEITLTESNHYFVNVNCADILKKEVAYKRVVPFKRKIDENGLRPGFNAFAYTGAVDLTHTTPEWEAVIPLGFAGLRARVAQYAAREGLNDAQRRFYREVLRVYDGIPGFLRRAAAVAEAAGREEMAKGLLALCEREPQSLFEALQMNLAYYTLQHMFEHSGVRTMGRLDLLLLPYFEKEERGAAEVMLADYIAELEAMQVPANMPFAIGGSDEEGRIVANELTYLLLDLYGRGSTANVKLHVLCAEETPEKLIATAFRHIREGKNSIVFLSEPCIVKTLEKLGASHEDAMRYHVVGCYECGAYNELASTSNGRVNVVKALEYALFEGRDLMTGEVIGLRTHSRFESFAALLAEFERQLRWLCNQSMLCVDLLERHYREIHTSPIFSGSTTTSLERGADIYGDYAAKYCNSSVNAIGLGTAADALCAIRRLVFEENRVTLDALREILRNNWAGEEALRLYAKNKLPKYGMGDSEADAVAAEIVNVMADAVNGRPNVKGGRYRLGLMSIHWRWEFGEHTGASADGRRAGETLSQNAGAAFGSDREGATAHLLSAAVLDYSRVANGSVVDVNLHASAIQGENGIKALAATLRTYFDLGGFAAHYNVLNAKTLRAAKAAPELYPNLQVRRCGWNVLFSELDDREKDELITRAEAGE